MLLPLRSRLDELALDALGPPPPLPAALAQQDDESIEIVFEDEDAIDLAVTGQFVRFSAPYERIEIEEVPSLAALSAKPTSFKRRHTTTFARTITAEQRRITTPIAVPMAAIAQAMAPASATVPFERVWFDDDEDVRLAAIEDPPVEVNESWWWLAISLVAGGAAVAAMAIWL